MLESDSASLETALTADQATLESELRRFAGTVEKVCGLRAGLAQGQAPVVGELRCLLDPAAELCAAFDLPWLWGGERIELHGVRPLTYIIVLLGSGKARLWKVSLILRPGPGACLATKTYVFPDTKTHV